MESITLGRSRINIPNFLIRLVLLGQQLKVTEEKQGTTNEFMSLTCIFMSKFL